MWCICSQTCQFVYSHGSVSQNCCLVVDMVLIWELTWYVVWASTSSLKGRSFLIAMIVFYFVRELVFFGYAPLVMLFLLCFYYYVSSVMCLWLRFFSNASVVMLFHSHFFLVTFLHLCVFNICLTIMFFRVTYLWVTDIWEVCFSCVLIRCLVFCNNSLDCCLMFIYD